jgi:hypothetical protein
MANNNMAASPTRNVKYIKVKVKDSSNHEVQNLISNQDRIVKYEIRQGGIIFAVLHDSYKKNLLGKLKEISHFLIVFETLKAIELDVQRQMKDLENIKIETLDFISKAESTIEEDIEFYQKEILIGEQELNFYNNQTFNKRETAQFTNNILLDLFDNDKWIFDMHNTKEYERSRGKMIREAEKKVYCSRENLVFLSNLRDILNLNEMSRMISEMEAIYLVISEKSKYLEMVFLKGNLINAENQDSSRALELIRSLIEDYKTFSSVYRQIKSLNEDLKYNIYGIRLNNDKWLISIPLKGEEAANPILLKLLDYMAKKVVSATDELLDMMNRDTARHYTNCMNDIKKNLEGITSDYNSIKLTGGVSSSDSSVSCNLKIKMKHSNRVVVDLSNVQFSDYTMQAKARLQEWEKRLNEIKAELSILDKFQKEFNEAEQKMIDNKNRKELELHQHSNEVSHNISGYSTLERSCQDKTLIIGIESIPALIGMFMKHINLQLNAICKSSASNIKAVDIDAAQLFEVMFKRLKKNNKIDYGFCVYFCCCCGAGNGKYSKFYKLFSCSEFSSYDFHEIMLNTRVCGSYKNRAGQSQEVFNNLRSEDIQDSLFLCAKNCIEIIVLSRMFNLKLNFKTVSERLKHYESELIHSLDIHKYKKLLKYAKERRYYKV